MIAKITNVRFLMILALSLFMINEASADIKRDGSVKDKELEVQRRATQHFDLQQNSISNLEFFTTNYGIFALNVATTRGSGYWPRGSRNQYIFGGGCWLGVEKFYTPPGGGERTLRQYCVVTYNPNNARSWMTPGMWNIPLDPNNVTKYRAYYSTDFSPVTGVPYDPSEGENWPIWDGSDNPEDRLKFDRYFGWYIPDAGDRNSNKYPRGPAFISGEDIFSMYHDQNLTRYDDGEAFRRNLGYPMGLQFQEMIYSWGFGDYKNFIFQKYEIHNISPDTLYNCWMAAVQDVDIARNPFLVAGARNDRVRFYEEEDTLNMAVQWTDPQNGEAGFGFGYLGFDFLESVATIKHFERDADSNLIFDPVTNRPIEVKRPDTDFIRKDSAYYLNVSQLGLVTFRNWSIEDDKLLDLERFQFISAAFREGDTGPGDKRYLMASGPFNMRPGDTARIVVGVILANTAKGGEADGTTEDMANLVALNKFAQTVYDANFRAPQPPDIPILKGWSALNHGTVIQWEGNSEMSFDDLEDGLDFLGYRLYRARRADLDTFNVDNITPGAISPYTGREITNGAGPFGWKEIANWELPKPFRKSAYRSTTATDAEYPFYDSLRIIGPLTNRQGIVEDSMQIRIMRVGQGVNLLSDAQAMQRYNNAIPTINFIDSNAFNAQPWGKYYVENSTQFINFRNPNTFLRYNPATENYLMDSIFVGVAKFDRSLVDYNPLLYRRITGEITPAFYNSLPRNGVVRRTILSDSLRFDSVAQVTVSDTFKVDLPIVDSIFYMDTYRRVTLADGTTRNVIDLSVWRPFSQIMNDTIHLAEVLEKIYELAQKKQVLLEFPQFEASYRARTEVIQPYMERITRGRTFVDIGDDNRDGQILFSEIPEETEKLINNVPYFYRLLSYDEGDVNKNTGPKLNFAGKGLPNFAETRPMASRVAPEIAFDIIEQTDNLLGGINSAEIFTIDNDRAVQLFSGDTLELRFSPDWDNVGYSWRNRDNTTNTLLVGLYQRQVELVNLSKGGQVLYSRTASFEQAPCKFNFDNLPTENTASRADSGSNVTMRPLPQANGDTIWVESDWGTPASRAIQNISGTFTTGDFTDTRFCYSAGMQQPAYGTLGIKFNYALRQFGGVYRADTAFVVDNPNINTNLTTFRLAEPERISLTSFIVDTTRNQFVVTGFNNGPGDYLVEFLPGGVQRMSLQAVRFADNGGSQIDEFEVPYLNVRVTNLREFNQFDPTLNQDVTIKYPGEMEHLNLPEILHEITGFGPTIPARPFPHPTHLIHSGRSSDEFLHKFNMSSYAVGNAPPDRTIGLLQARNHRAYPAEGRLAAFDVSHTGYQGKYFLSAQSARGNRVDFTHIVNIGGAPFALDYSNFGRGYSNNPMWAQKPHPTLGNVFAPNGEDFKAGNTIRLQTYGGVFGLPLPGASIKFAVRGVEQDQKYTDAMMDQIKVVPNPYYLSHQGQNSPYDSKIYFTKLPKVCTIEIYTVAGDLVRSLRHDEFSAPEPERQAIEVWDLLTESGMRAQSQSFVAVIRTPDGAETMQTFSVVVGSFRLIERQ